MKTYFRCENANRLIEGIKFEPIEHAKGTLIGVYQAESDSEISKNITKFSKDPLSAVEVISEAEYVAELKKKAPALRDSTHSNTPYRPEPVSLKGNGRAVVAPAGNPTVKVEKGLEKVEDAIKTGTVVASK